MIAVRVLNFLTNRKLRHPKLLLEPSGDFIS
jgi:hypothetical protein